MNMNLSERHKFIIRFLLDCKVTTIRTISHKLGVSERTVMNDLNCIENILGKMGLKLLRKPSVGISIIGDIEAKAKVKFFIDNEKQSSFDNSKDRQVYIINRLMNESDYLSSQVFLDELYISKGTLESDLNELKKWLVSKNIILKRKPNKGIKIEGDEKYIRSLLVELHRNEMDISKRIAEEKQDINPILYNQFKFIKENDLNIIESLVREAEKSLNLKFVDAAFQALVLHIAIAIKRVKTENELDLQDEVLYELKKKPEYRVAKVLVKKLEAKFNISFRISECGYITLHLLSGKVYKSISDLNQAFNSEQKDIDKYTLKICYEMVEIVKQQLNIDFTKDNMLINGLYIHLKAAINRLKSNMPINNPYLEEIKINYTLAFEAAARACGEIEKTYEININEDEIAYIAMHFGAALERNGNMNLIKNIIIICTTGLGTSQLVAAKIKRVFPELHIMDVLSATNVNNYHNLSKVDLIISTVPINNINIPTIQVNPFLGKEDMENIKSFLNSKEIKQRKEDLNGLPLAKLFNKNLIIILDEKKKETVIKKLVEMLENMNAVEESYFESVIYRENIASTAYEGFAIPHGDPNKVKKSCIAAAILISPIEWNDKLVNKVFLIAVGKDSVKEVRAIFDDFYDLIDDKTKMKSINSSKGIDEIYKILIAEDKQ
jgi:lichenan operon transcriptional antiterminator